MISAAENAHAGGPDSALGRARGFIQAHPEWWVALAAAAGWMAMALLPHPQAASHHHGGHGHAPARPFDPLATAIMIVAMMLPLVIPSIRHAARSSRQRHRAAACFLAGYLAVWMLAMLAITGMWLAAESLAGWTVAAVGAVIAAAAWETTPARQRHADGCEQAEPLDTSGWRGDAGRARFGAASGIACAGTCWAIMAVCVAFAHSLPLMAVLFGVQVSGRYRRLSPTSRALAVLVTGLAALAARLTFGHG